MVPGGLADELLQRLALLVVQVGDGLGVLVLQVGEQPGDVVAGVVALLAALEEFDEGVEEAFQPGQHAAEDAGIDLGVGQAVGHGGRQNGAPSAAPSEGFRSPEELCRKRLGPGQATATVELTKTFWLYVLVSAVVVGAGVAGYAVGGKDGVLFLGGGTLLLVLLGPAVWKRYK